MNKQRLFIFLIVFAILILVFTWVWYSQVDKSSIANNNAVVPATEAALSQQLNQGITNSWLTFIGTSTSEYEYFDTIHDKWIHIRGVSASVRYPDHYWSFQDRGAGAFDIIGPYRSDLPGANEPAAFRMAVHYESSTQTLYTITDYRDVGFYYRYHPGDQSLNPVFLSLSYIVNTPEYKIAHLILSTAKVVQ